MIAYMNTNITYDNHHPTSHGCYLLNHTLYVRYTAVSSLFLPMYVVSSDWHSRIKTLALMMEAVLKTFPNVNRMPTAANKIKCNKFSQVKKFIWL